MRNRTVRLLLASLVTAIAGLTLASETSAQSDRGTIQGLVTDSSGAVVPGARVEIIQTQTNSTIVIATNNEGLYTAPNLPRGEYRVVVTKDGFAAAVTEGIDLRAGIQIRADVTLQPTGVQEQVTVTAPNVDVSSINNSATLSEKLINELPVIVTGTKRDITSLLQNLPGFTGGGTFVPRANGANVGDTEVFIDGGRSSQFIQRGALTEVGPAIEQVGEFSVVSNGFNAEYGGVGIWFSNVTIKSGTNRFSGSVFDHFGTDALNARSYFQASKSDYKQHEGGFTLGGPVVLPKYDGRNRTFFFGSLGLFFSRSGAGGALITVPTQAFLRGDFSGLVDAQGRQIPIYDPATTRPDGRGGFVRDQFSGNIIPPDRISPAARVIAQYIPAPDLTGTVNNFRDRKAPTWPFYDTYTPLGKLDHNINTAQRLSVMFTRQIRHRVLWGNPGSGLGTAPAWGDEQTNPLDWITDQVANSWKVRVNHDHVISAQMVNHVTVSVDRYVNAGRNKTANQGWAGKLGIRGIPADDGSFPSISFQGGTAAPVNFGRAYDEDWRDISYTVNESLTRTLGRHTMKFGGEAGRYTVDRFFTGGARRIVRVQQFHNQPAERRGGIRHAGECRRELPARRGVPGERADSDQDAVRVPALRGIRPGRMAADARAHLLVRSALGRSAADDGSGQPDQQLCPRHREPARRWEARCARVCRREWQRAELSGHLVQGLRSPDRDRVLTDAEDDRPFVRGDLLQRNGQPDDGDRAGLCELTDLHVCRQLHAGIQLEYADVPAGIQSAAGH
jgi:hypothetical protein